MRIPVDEALADPALDAAVAKIRGEEKRLEWRCVLEGHWIDGDPETGWCYYCRELVSDGGKVSVPDKPVSQHILAAWELAEESNLLFDYELRQWVDTWQIGNHVWDRDGNGEFQVYAEAEIAPLTIVRAWLKAKGVKYVEVPE